MGKKSEKLLSVTLVALLFSLTGCSGEALKDVVWPADGKVMGMRIHCNLDCPELFEIENALLKMETLWAPHLDFDPRRVWTKYAITFSDGYRERPDGVQILGATSHAVGAHWIYQPYECSPHPKGLCPGIFDWELGLGLAERQLGYEADELQKLEWRSERGLLNELEEAQ